MDSLVCCQPKLSIDWLLDPIQGIDETQALATAVMIALNSDRRALDDDVPPLRTPPGQTPDRRGWWADTDAQAIWGGWPIGSRLWLMTRDTITDSAARQGATIERARRFIAEAIDPFVEARICSSYAIDLAQTKRDAIGGTLTIFRGPKEDLALQFADLWTELGG